MDAAKPETPAASQADPLAALKLAHAPALGALRSAGLVRQFGSAGAVCAAPRSALREAGVAADTIGFLLGDGGPAVAAALRWAQRADCHLLVRGEPAYPRLLEELADPPPVLFVRGDCEVLDTLQLAMVGSRKPTPAGRRTAFEFARHLAGCGLTITSGLALGIDAASHEGALAADGLSVAVIGTGHEHCYPAAHTPLLERIAAAGAVVSELPLAAPPRRENFPRRNRLISALSAGVLVIEAAARSGSLITARLAAEQGREVFAIPGSIHSPQSRGTNGLIRHGAKLVETAEHVLEELAPQAAAMRQRTPARDPESGPQSGAGSELDSDYRALLEAVEFAPTSVDTLVENTGYSAPEVASMLLMLELQGHVQSVAGGLYLRTGQRPAV